MRATIIAAGTTFGKLTVIERAGTSSDGKATWLCACSCGSEPKVYIGNNLRRGNTSSCGCLQKEKARELHGTHLMTNSTEYSIWTGMCNRCLNITNQSYTRYGGRSITVCDEWKDSFETFYADMGPRPEGTSLDRIDNNGDYEKTNCRWATRIEQANNTSTNHMVTAFGETHSIADWARKQELAYDCLFSRIVRLGWDVERALTTQARKSTKSKAI